MHYGDTLKAIIDGLSEKQRGALGLIAINQDWGLHPKTLVSLERRGLIVGRDERLGGAMPVRIRRYHVPTPVHIAWCQWCSENLTDAETEARG